MKVSTLPKITQKLLFKEHQAAAHCANLMGARIVPVCKKFGPSCANK